MFKDMIKNRKKKKDRDISFYLTQNYKIAPTKEASIITITYGVFGFLWIALSDKILFIMIRDINTYREIQTYKGAFYVLITMVLIYTLVRKRSGLFQKAILKIAEAYEDLQSTYKELVATEEKLENLAYYDNLTQLPNRRLLESEVKALINQNIPFAVVYMDVDNFKYINDTLGHAIGDEFLIYIAKKLKKVLDLEDIAARISGDEYAVLLKESYSKDELEKKVKEITDAIGKTWKAKHHEFFISLSIGVSIYPYDGLDYNTLFRNADIAMYKAKKSGKGRHIFFTEEILIDNVQSVQMANQLQYALENNELSLYYQPQFSLSTGKITGIEALIRWIHPEKGFISPADFIPLAEETGQIYDIDKWVIKTALLQKEKFEKEGIHNIDLSINLSSKALVSDMNFDEIERIIEGFDVDYSHVVVEITETAVISDVEFAIERLEKLKQLGFKIALDDFGTGYSSLTYLKKLPIDIIKLDRSFVKRIEENSKDAIIIKALLFLARDLKYKIVAEGIETKEQLEFLKKYSCDYGQGFLMGRPLSIKYIYEKLIAGFQINML